MNALVEKALREASFLDKAVLTPEQLAKKHSVAVKYILTQLEKGIKVELEHTSNKGAARKIALKHLEEMADYYEKLEKMEK